MADNTADSAYLTDISAKDKPWDKHRACADHIRDLYQAVKFDKYADRIKRCGQVLEFALQGAEDGELGLRLRSAHFCRVRHCPVCQWRRSLKWTAKVFQSLPDITKAYPTHRWLFLTLTVRNCDLSDLRANIGEMNKAFVRLSQLKIFPAVGWIKSLEVTRNAETGQAHPHFHCLLLVPASYFGKAYIKQADWQMLWQQSLRIDYLPVVNIKAIKQVSGDRQGEDRRVTQQSEEMLGNQLANAICETLKYSVKEEDLIADKDWLAELTLQLHKTKAVAVGGCLRQFLKDEAPNEDLVNIDESNTDIAEDDLRLWFGWREAIKRYKLKQ